MARAFLAAAAGAQVFALLALLALAIPAAAHDESAAPLLRPDVEAAWHEPDPVAPHTQWQGFLRLRPGHAVESAAYQVCRVGQACFAPPHPAERVDALTFRLDTRGYLANGQPVDYQAGWRIGVKWILTERDGDGGGNATRQAAFPQGPDPASPACAADAHACAEAHYLAFDIPRARAASAPPPAAAVAALALSALAWRARQAGGRRG